MESILGKRLTFLAAVLGLCFWVATSKAEVINQADIINNVKEALKSGSAKEVSKFLNATIDLTIEGKMESYSKTQAEFALKDFFKNNPPSSFVIVHQGASKGGLPYAIGQYNSRGKVYRVWMRIKSTNDKYLIHEMSFIKE